MKAVAFEGDFHTFVNDGDTILEFRNVGDLSPQTGIDAVQYVEGDVGEHDAETVSRIGRILLEDLNRVSGLSLLHRFFLIALGSHGGHAPRPKVEKAVKQVEFVTCTERCRRQSLGPQPRRPQLAKVRRSVSMPVGMSRPMAGHFDHQDTHGIASC
jgi:hypothetical protein